MTGGRIPASFASETMRYEIETSATPAFRHAGQRDATPPRRSPSHHPPPWIWISTGVLAPDGFSGSHASGLWRMCGPYLTFSCVGKSTLKAFPFPAFGSHQCFIAQPVSLSAGRRPNTRPTQRSIWSPSRTFGSRVQPSVYSFHALM